MEAPEVNEQDKQRAMEQLKEIILGNIEKEAVNNKIQEENRERGFKILRRQTVIMVCNILIVIVGFGCLYYLGTRPAPATLITLKNIENIQKNLELEHRLILMDRDDVAKARVEVIEMQKLLFKQDSLKESKMILKH